MTSNDLHPVPVLAVLSAISASLGATIVGAGYGNAPNPGIYMVLTGLWFGAVMGFAVWRWAEASLSASAITLLVTWFAWEAAVNVAIQIDQPWPDAIEIAKVYKSYLTGVIAGAVGAFVTWIGIALNVETLRRSSVAAEVTVTGALFGLLFPAVDYFDSGLVLLLPWQTAVAMVIGFKMPKPQASRRCDPRIVAI
jgi:hypothetical protein